MMSGSGWRGRGCKIIWACKRVDYEYCTVIPTWYKRGGNHTEDQLHSGRCDTLSHTHCGCTCYSGARQFVECTFLEKQIAIIQISDNMPL